MSEPQELKDSLARAVADEPPLAFDPDALINRAQREVRRRTLIAVGAATAMVVLVAIAVPTAVGFFRGAGHTTAAASSSTAPVLTTLDTTPAAPASTFAVPRSYTADELFLTSKRFSTELLQLMPKVVPEAADLSIQPWGTGDAESISPGPGRLHTFAWFLVKGTPTAIALTVNDSGAGQSANPQDNCSAAHVSGPDCVIYHSANAAQVIERQNIDGAQILSVIDYRADGSTVSAAGYNYDPTARTAVKFAAAPLVTTQQLFILATQAGFTFG